MRIECDWCPSPLARAKLTRLGNDPRLLWLMLIDHVTRTGHAAAVTAGRRRRRLTRACLAASAGAALVAASLLVGTSCVTLAPGVIGTGPVPAWPGRAWLAFLAGTSRAPAIDAPVRMVTPAATSTAAPAAVPDHVPAPAPSTIPGAVPSAEPATAESALVERPAWLPPDVARVPFTRNVERWRPIVRELLAEAWAEGRLDGPAERLDDDLILALIQQESAGDPEAVSWAGALGLMQVMPFTFAEMMAGSKALAPAIDRANMLDIYSNMRAGIRYLALAMQEHEGNIYWALASYNAGIEVVHRWRAAGLYAVPPIGGYQETADYTQIIMRRYLRHRPGLEMYVPPAMVPEHVPGAIQLPRESGRW